MLRSIGTFPANRPVIALVIAFIGAIASVFAVSRLRADTSLAPLFSRDDPAGRAMLRVLDQFSAAEELIVVASLPDDRQAADPDTLIVFARRLTSAVQSSSRAQSLVNSATYRADEQTQAFFKEVLVPNGLFYLDDQAFAQAKARLTREQMLEQFRQNETMISAPGPAAQALAKVFLQDPLRLHEFILNRIASSRPFDTFKGSDAFISPDGRSILVRISGKRPPSDIDFAKRLTREISALSDAANGDHLKLQYTGSYAIATAAEAGIRRDMIGTVTGSVVLLQLLFLLAYRKPFRLFLLAFGPVALGVLYGFGIYAGVLPTLTPMTAVIGGVLAGMGIDYSIQYIAHYDNFRGKGQSPIEAAGDTTLQVGPAIFAAWFTSVIGFVAIGSSKVPALRDFAVLGTLGLAGAFIGALWVLPALLVLSDKRSTEARAGKTMLSSRVSFVAFLNWLKGRRLGSIIFSSILLVASLCVLATHGDPFPLESDLTVMHPRPNAPLDAQREIADKFGGSPGSLIVYLKANSPAELLNLSHRVQDRLMTQHVRAAGVTATFGLPTLLPDPARTAARLAAIGQNDAQRVISDFNAVVADSIFDPAAFKPYVDFLNHLLTRTQPPDIALFAKYPSLANTILPKSSSPTSLPTESIMLVSVRGNMDDRAARERVVSAAGAAIADLPGATLTGMSVLARNTERTIRHDLPRLILIAVIIVAAYLALHFRNLSAAMLALIPTIFGLAMLLAFMRLSGQKLNMINLAALPLLIGIDVDYGIFLVHLARSRHIKSGDDAAALAPTTAAVILCALSMIVGFASLITTSVPAIRSLGIAMAFGVASCLIGTLFLLLPLLLPRSSRDAARSSG
jgi:predicted RND superfamily exporter protein